MMYSVSKLMRESTGSCRRYTLENVEIETQPGVVLEVAGEVQFLKTDKGIWVSASLTAEIPCACSRCLIDMVQKVHMSIEEEYLPEFDIFTGARLYESDDMSENFFIDKTHTIDLTEATMQYISMNTPISPICSANCAGICMTCGADMNRDTYQCDQLSVDPRWGALLEVARVSNRQN